MFSGSGEGGWLNESDLDFFARPAPGEASGADAVTPEQQAVVQVGSQAGF